MTGPRARPAAEATGSVGVHDKDLPGEAVLRGALAGHRGGARTSAPAASAWRRAAVLVPLMQDPPGVLLTQRATTLRQHPGQVAFPGGCVDSADADAAATALREAHEEIGLDPRDVTVLGHLPDTHVGTGFIVTPVVALVAGRPHWRLAEQEVACVFVLPLTVLRDPDAPRRRSVEFGGVTHSMWAWPHPAHDIWGATAAILVDLAAVLASVG